MNQQHYQPHYQSIEVLELNFNGTDFGLFSIRTKLGWCTEALFKAQVMIEKDKFFIEDAQVEESGALLHLRYEFTSKQVEQLKKFV